VKVSTKKESSSLDATIVRAMDGTPRANRRPSVQVQLADNNTDAENVTVSKPVLSSLQTKQGDVTISKIVSTDFAVFEDAGVSLTRPPKFARRVGDAGDEPAPTHKPTMGRRAISAFSTRGRAVSGEVDGVSESLLIFSESVREEKVHRSTGNSAAQNVLNSSSDTIGTIVTAGTAASGGCEVTTVSSTGKIQLNKQLADGVVRERKSHHGRSRSASVSSKRSDASSNTDNKSFVRSSAAGQAQAAPPRPQPVEQPSFAFNRVPVRNQQRVVEPKSPGIHHSFRRITLHHHIYSLLFID
jgi:hypothetical protein